MKIRFAKYAGLALFLVLGVYGVWAEGAEGGAPVFAGARYALVIGNGDYANITKLKNPANDARGMKGALEGLGFHVDMLIDADLAQMEEGVVRLRGRLDSGGVGFVFFAGHGVSSNGVDYLLPVDFEEFGPVWEYQKALSLDVLQGELKYAGELNIFVFDASRDAPFTRELKVVDAPQNEAAFMEVFSTGRGRTALDGEGDNGLFTGHLIKNLTLPFFEIKEVFTKTIEETRAASKGRQIPEFRSNYHGELYLAGAPPDALPAPARAPRVEPGARFALVIGNSAYGDEGALPNAANDAEDVAAGLRALGYETALVKNANRGVMRNAILDFKDNLNREGGNTLGFFWYAGHGVQYNGENYLIPVDSGITRREDLETEAVSLAYLLNRLGEVTNTGNLVVLDACRNNPFRFRGRGAGDRGLSIIGGGIPPSSLILYSTAADTAALDGGAGARNSPFAGAFLKFLSDPREFDSVYRDITLETMAATGQAQAPSRYGQFLREFYLVPEKK